MTGREALAEAAVVMVVACGESLSLTITFDALGPASLALASVLAMSMSSPSVVVPFGTR